MKTHPGIWIDADSCPRKVRDIIARASERTGIPALFISNRHLPVMTSPLVELRIIEDRSVTVDDAILEESRPDDIVVTRDIPLAARLLEKGCRVLNDRGDRFSGDTIRERLSLRDLMKDARERGLAGDGKRTFGRREVHAFAAALDRELALLQNRGYGENT